MLYCILLSFGWVANSVFKENIKLVLRKEDCFCLACLFKKNKTKNLAASPRHAILCIKNG